MKAPIIGDCLSPPSSPVVTGVLSAKQLALTQLTSRAALPVLTNTSLGAFASNVSGFLADERYCSTQAAKGASWIAGHQAPDPLIVSLNPVLNVITKLPEMVGECREYVKSLKDSTLEQGVVKTGALTKTISSYARNICQMANLGADLTTILAKAGIVTSEAIQGLKIVETVGSVFGVIHNISRGALSAYGLAKTAHYKTLFGRAKDLNQKLQVLKTLVSVSCDEIQAALGTQDKVNFLTQYYEAKKQEGIKQAATQIALPGSIESYMNQMAEWVGGPEFKTYFQQKLGLSDDLINDLTPHAFLGLIFFVKQLALKKQNEFLSAVTDSQQEAANLKKMIATFVKVQGVAEGCFEVKQPMDPATSLLFKKLDVSMNRKQYAQTASCVIAALSIVGLVSTFLTPIIPFAPLISLVCFTIAGYLDYSLALNSFVDSVKDYQKLLDHQSQDWSSWFKAMPWKSWVNIGINVALVALTVALCLSPLGQSLGVLAIAGAVISLAIYTLYTTATVNEVFRKFLVGVAEKVDTLWQKIAYKMGAPIALTGEQQTQLEQSFKDLKKARLMRKIRALDLDDQCKLAKDLGLDLDQSEWSFVQGQRVETKLGVNKANLVEAIKGKIDDDDRFYTQASIKQKELTIQTLVVSL
jgi:hypothetical protein